ncbi:hypothetical protein ATO4_21912 [Aurantimonas sp. 22II-16-19i]|nr:hypothetical protein ATO4_21912 [Aurantimonas sp. 22II-16-19i]
MSISLRLLVTEAIDRVRSTGLVLLVDDEARRIAWELAGDDRSLHHKITTMLTDAACREGVAMRLERSAAALAATHSFARVAPRTATARRVCLLRHAGDGCDETDLKISFRNLAAPSP